ncbi:transcription repressor OFP7-like [Prosopis cineraria]|uniref:transcription repressor OFP7-like n=1 Tax=Prosopis cineraria TaxID=364024 RepID=UPI00240FD799|nr:transcription repressor OFP7-like [Prosopis cineraria]
MAKRFKLKLGIPSFQLCRSKQLSNFPGNPVPAIYRLSPVNPRARDVANPYMPDPPPTTPENHYLSRPVCCESKFRKMGREKGKKVKPAGDRRSVTSVVSSRTRRGNFLMDQDEESESLVSGLNIFSDEFCHEAAREREIGRHVISSAEKAPKQIFQRSEMTGRKKTTKTSAAGSMTWRTVEGKVKESFTVVKKSKDPYEDFKKSMLEMIMEMEMFETRDLEQLLQCFLTLNSRHYHGIIARAFMEIWQELFSEPCVDDKKCPRDRF